jgi:hypothetical protein
VSYSEYIHYNIDPAGRTRFYGTYLGTVTNATDPEGRNRVQVKVPQISGEDILGWALPSDLYSTKLLLPSIGDYVWVTFQDGDASYPIWSSGSGSGASQGSYGSFYSTITQPMVSTAAGQAIKFDSTNIANGISIVSNGTALTRITFANAGVYSLGFAGQLSDSSNGSQIHDVSFWLVKNGSSALATSFDTNVTYQVPQLTNWTYQIQAAAGDYYEIFWHASSTAVSLIYSGALSSPTRPSYPSAFIDITQVMSVQAGPTGPQGPRGYTGADGVDGTNGTDGADGADGLWGVSIASTAPDHGQLWADTNETSSGKSYAIASKTADYTILVKDEFITCDATAGAFTLTLPDVWLSSNRRYFVKKIDNTVNQVIVTGTIEGDSNVRLGPGRDDMTIISDGLNFYYEGF